MEHEATPSAAPYAVVIDDNPVILLHAADILEDAGFSVFASAGSAGAIEWLEMHGEKIVLIFTNVDIPGAFNGFELSQFVSRKWPHIALMVSSGKHEPGAGSMPKDAVFVSKPFSGDDVRAAARDVLAVKNPELLTTGALIL